MKTALCAIAIALVSMAAQAKDYEIRISKVEDLILTDKTCDLDPTMGGEWKKTIDQIGGKQDMPSPYCWKHVADKIYVVDDISKLTNSPPWGEIADTSLYYEFSSSRCQMHIPGVDLSGWFEGDEALLSDAPDRVKANQTNVADQIGMCWRATSSGIEAIDQPRVYSEFEARESVVP